MNLIRVKDQLKGPRKSTEVEIECRKELRNEISDQVQRFIDSGGKINQLEAGASAIVHKLSKRQAKNVGKFE